MNMFHAIILGFVSAFIVALVSIQTFLRYIKHHTFTAFGIYRIAIGLAFLLLNR